MKKPVYLVPPFIGGASELEKQLLEIGAYFAADTIGEELKEKNRAQSEQQAASAFVSKKHPGYDVVVVEAIEDGKHSGSYTIAIDDACKPWNQHLVKSCENMKLTGTSCLQYVYRQIGAFVSEHDRAFHTKERPCE